MNGPEILTGVRMLDLTRVMSGPYATSMLADLGAEVIKIEQPDIGDDARHMGPFIDGDSSYFALLNRDKKSITVNLKTAAGQDIIRRLAANSDVLVENFRPGVMQRLGLDYESLAAADPRLIYASITGFGADSPYAGHPALDITIQAMSGLMSVTGPAGGPATAVGESMGDVATGMFAAFGIVSALYDRQRTGKGQYLDVAMFDSLFAMQLTGLAQQLYTGETPKPRGNRHPVTYPVDSFPTRDGDIVICCFNDQLFSTLCQVIDRADLAEASEYRDNDARDRNMAPLREEISSWSGALERETALAKLSAAGIPAAPVWTLAQAAGSEHAAARGLVRDGRHPRLGQVPLTPQPVRFSGRAAPDHQTTPTLSEHTESVLGDLLDLDPETLARYRKEGVI